MVLFFRSGQQWKTFEVYKRIPSQDERGRIFYQDGKEKTEEVQGFLSSATQKEKNRWKQASHPITHTIVLQGNCTAEAESILCWNDEKYYVYGKENPGGLDFFHILYCQRLFEESE